MAQVRDAVALREVAPRPQLHCVSARPCSAQGARPEGREVMRMFRRRSASAAPSGSALAPQCPFSLQMPQSPLTDSNRRPLPYHGGLRRHGRSRTVTNWHEVPAIRAERTGRSLWLNDGRCETDGRKCGRKPPFSGRPAISRMGQRSGLPPAPLADQGQHQRGLSAGFEMRTQARGTGGLRGVTNGMGDSSAVAVVLEQHLEFVYASL